MTPRFTFLLLVIVLKERLEVASVSKTLDLSSMFFCLSMLLSSMAEGAVIGLCAGVPTEPVA